MSEGKNGVDKSGPGEPDTAALMGFMKELKASRASHKGDLEAALWARVFTAQAQVLTGVSTTKEQVQKIPELAQLAADGAVRRWRQSLDRDFKAPEKPAESPEKKPEAQAT